MTDATSVWFTSASDGSYSSSESAVKTSLSSDVSHAQTRLARPLSNKTQMRTAQDIAHDLSFFLNNTYILLRMYGCKSECEVTLRS